MDISRNKLIGWLKWTYTCGIALCGLLASLVIVPAFVSFVQLTLLVAAIACLFMLAATMVAEYLEPPRAP